MKHRTLIVIVSALAMFAPTSLAADTTVAQQAGDWVELAEMQLSSGDFAAALESYAEAVKAEPKNDVQKQQYALLRQIIRIRWMYATEDDPERKQQMVPALRSFYYDKALHGEALKLDRQIHTDAPSSSSAANLSESLLELNQNDEVVALLTRLPRKQQTSRTRALLAIAMLRNGDTEKAEAVADKLGVPEKGDPDLYFELACMYSLLGETGQSSEMLTRSFQMTRPSLLEKAHARALVRTDLTMLRDSGSMETALAVKSKVAESSCSGKSSCAGCPSASACGSTDGATKKASNNEKNKKE